MSAKLELDWMCVRHLPGVLQIDEDCFAWNTWNEDVFRHVLAKQNHIGLVACNGDQVLGFVVYSLHERYIGVVNLAVAPQHQRRGIGQCLLERLKSKLGRLGRSYLQVCVRETNLPALLFFRSQGFRAYRLDRAYYETCNEDAIRMRYRTAVLAVQPPDPGGDASDEAPAVAGR